MTDFGILVGKTLARVEGANVGGQVIVFTTEAGEVFQMDHCQDCCEYVRLEDVEGDVSDLIGSPVTVADVASNVDAPAPQANDCYTWTFYRIATAKGWVVLRWLGESNGYYSESVDFQQL